MEAPLRQSLAIVGFWLVGTSAAAQQVPDIGFVSVGRAAPLKHDVNKSQPVGSTLTRDGQFIGAAPPGQTPPGPLAAAGPGSLKVLPALVSSGNFHGAGFS